MPKLRRPFLRWATMRLERCFWRRLRRSAACPVMNVMADPRRLLTAYNDCDSGSTLPFSFDTLRWQSRWIISGSPSRSRSGARYTGLG